MKIYIINKLCDMKKITLLLILLLNVVFTFSQSNSYYNISQREREVLEYNDFSFITDSLSAAPKNDTIPGVLLITEGECEPAIEISGYLVRESYLFGRDLFYLDKYMQRLGKDVEVWFFKPKIVNENRRANPERRNRDR